VNSGTAYASLNGFGGSNVLVGGQGRHAQWRRGRTDKASRDWIM
jgi:hypothetical protein